MGKKKTKIRQRIQSSGLFYDSDNLVFCVDVSQEYTELVGPDPGDRVHEVIVSRLLLSR